MASKTIDQYNSTLLTKYGRVPYFVQGFTGMMTKCTHQCVDCGHSFEMLPNNAIYSSNKCGMHPCPECKRSRIADSRRTTVESFTLKLEKLLNGKPGYVIDGFTGSDAKCSFMCEECKSTFDVRPANVAEAARKGRRYCPHCNKMARDLRPYQERLNSVHKGRIISIGSYSKRKQDCEHECSDCKTRWMASPNNVLRGTGCPQCSASSPEKSMVEFIKDILPPNTKIITSDRKILDGKELDILLPDFHVAFEFDQLYWHGENGPGQVGRDYHLSKTIKAASAGVRLIHIFSDEWSTKRAIMEDRIANAIGTRHAERIYARKCTITEMDCTEARSFMSTNHMQGAGPTTLALCLRDTLGRPVSVATFSSTRRSLGKDGSSLELTRFASMIGVKCPGALSRLSKFLMNNYDVPELITYADRRWGEGIGYNKSGFIFSHFTKPGYWYFKVSNATKKFHRFSFRRGILEEKFKKTFDPSMTEWEIMKSMGYDRIWDCGNAAFIMRKDVT
jgi:hypothetical protein